MTLNGYFLKLPFTGHLISARKVSSIFVRVDIGTDIYIVWDGEMYLEINLGDNMRGQVCMCVCM